MRILTLALIVLLGSACAGAASRPATPARSASPSPVQPASATAVPMPTPTATAAPTPRPTPTATPTFTPAGVAVPAPQPHKIAWPFTFADRGSWVLGYTEGGVVLRPDRDAPLYLPNPIYGAIGDITFVDLLHGWATGRIARGPQAACQQAFPYPPCRDVILATKDGGRSWSIIREVTTTGVTGYTFHGLQFVDVRHGWTVQFLDSCSTSCGTQLLATEDGGATWTVRWYSAPDRVTNTFRFVDALRGWAIETEWWTDDTAIARTTRLIATTDGGKSWTTQLEGIGVVDITALDGTHAWALAHDASCAARPCPVRLYRTTDGQRWSLVADRLDAHACAGTRIYRPLFLDAEHGVIATGGRETTDRGGILVTTDGGQTWSCAASQPTAANAQGPALAYSEWAIVIGVDRAGGDHLFWTEDLGGSWLETDLSRHGY